MSRFLDKTQPPILAYKKSLMPEKSVLKPSEFTADEKLRLEFQSRLEDLVAEFIKYNPRILAIEGKFGASQHTKAPFYTTVFSEIKMDFLKDDFAKKLDTDTNFPQTT